ncbi:hypothetical protein C0993_012547, partial [Termitomyces sp. T159_Od127]
QQRGTVTVAGGVRISEQTEVALSGGEGMESLVGRAYKIERIVKGVRGEVVGVWGESRDIGEDIGNVLC